VDLTQYFKKANNFDFWFYTGSLTLPYCTDNQLNWIVIKQTFKISTKQK
jgi:carbonic anhydrase